MTSIAIAPEAPPLPGLRQELQINPGAPLVNGAPSWTLFDPIRHAFFQLGRIEFRIFKRWSSGSFDGLADELSEDGLDGEEIDATIARVVEFSLTNHLTIAPMGDTVATLVSERERARAAWWKWAFDHYLFFRIPLVRPAAFLERTLPRVAPLWSARVLYGFAALALLGLYLVSRQWDVFMASFLYFFSWQGLIAYAFGLSAVKVIHELGHAYTATRFGARVPSMGVSFLVMFPVLYTDTTAAWRLTSRKERLAIDVAGVAAELMVASLATLAWVALPDGSLRSMVFVLATSSWIMSLIVNLNPFMRFDGYYVLADLLDIPNLQPRAFALGRWRMRELLFGLGDPPPESMPDQMRRGLIAYAWFTWAYRLVLFLGIALLVYTLFFKVLGIILFLVEIFAFIAAPVIRELKTWWADRSRISSTPHGRTWPWLVGSLALACVLPLDRSVSAPALLAPIGAYPLVSGDPAQIEQVLVQNGAQVKAGAPLFVLVAPELDQEDRLRAARMRELEVQLARLASDGKDLSNRTVLERQLATERAGMSGVAARRERLVLRAPDTGIVTDLEPGIHAGRWLGGAEVIARVVKPGEFDVQAYLEEDTIWRLRPGAEGRFVPDDPALPSRPARLVERGTAAMQYLDQPVLGSVNGGPLAVDQDMQKRLRPRTALYRARFLVPVEGVPERHLLQPVPGQIVIDAAPESLLSLFARRFSRVFRREASAS
jgi:putative peptide zinc metalloprotease protein